MYCLLEDHVNHLFQLPSEVSFLLICAFKEDGSDASEELEVLDIEGRLVLLPHLLVRLLHHCHLTQRVRPLHLLQCEPYVAVYQEHAFHVLPLHLCLPALRILLEQGAELAVVEGVN